MNMPSKKTRSKKKNKKYRLDLSRTSLFFWCLGSLFLLAWIFVLGILVGRGFLPQGVNTLTKLQTPIATLKEMVSNRKASDLDDIKGLDKDPEFKFYDQLSTKKEGVTNKHKSGGKKTRDKIRHPSLSGTGSRSVKKDKVSGEGAEIKPTQTGRYYTVQVASLDSENRAVKMANQLKNRGYPAYIHKATIKGKTCYRVRCGRFKDKKDAGDLYSLLAKREKIKGFITSETARNSEPDIRKDAAQTKIATKTRPTQTGGNYTVQAASFDSKIKADKMSDRLKNRGYPAYVIKVNIKGKAYYRVRCGKFKNKKDAGDCAMLLAQKETIKGFVTNIVP